MAARAQAEPAALTPKEIADGWILLFDGETDFGWKPRGQVQWSIAEGSVQSSGEARGMLATTTEFADCEVAAEVWVDEKANSGLFLRAPAEGEITPLNSYEINVFDAHPKFPTGSVVEGARTRTRIPSVGKWTRILARAEGDRITVTMNGRKTADLRDNRRGRGVIAIQHFGDGAVRFRNIKLRPLAMKPIFNGKDLTGWKVLEGRRSVYSVTPEGWLNVKNGNGDIQTEGQYKDFALQMEILSNGDRLNSGVFFRALPGQFWSGYESQIRNQWQGDDRAKPVDFGTGGIYNFQPARRVIPSDREWFSKTIVVHGSHMAVWVNGVQVSDFTDTRPVHASGSARRGLRADAGVISIQGHDPTTDLSFRKIKIAEMPAP